MVDFLVSGMRHPLRVPLLLADLGLKKLSAASEQKTGCSFNL